MEQLCPGDCLRLIVGKEFNPVKVECAMTDFPGKTHRLFRVWWFEFNIDVRADAQVRNAEETHPAFAQIDTQRVHVCVWRENLDGGVDPLPAGAPGNWETALENHGLPCAFKLPAPKQLE